MDAETSCLGRSSPLPLSPNILLHPQMLWCWAEEKVDGSNLGLSFDKDTRELRFQKRGHWVSPSSEAQYAKLEVWASMHHAALWEMLGKDIDLSVPGLFTQ